MEKIKKITVEQLRQHANAPLRRTIMWHGIAVSVRTLLPIREVSQFINSVMESCFDKTHDIFVPEMIDFAFRANVILRYASVELPDDIEEQYTILYNSDIYDTIISSVNQGQISALRSTINTCMQTTNNDMK